MNQAQFNLIAAKRFPRLSPQTVDACRSVIIEGVTSYAAEQAFKCPTGTVNRYVLRINAEFALCQEIAAGPTPELADVVGDMLGAVGDIL